MPAVLVVGADGMIGSALLRHLAASGMAVRGTTRRNAPGRLLPFDLGAPSWEHIEADYAVAVICAGIASLAACRADPAGTARINVENTLALAARLAARGCFVVGLSTNLVFDGTYERPGVGDPVNPSTEYGRQKAALETGFAALGARAAIVRLTKVVAPDAALYRGWAQDLRAGRTIRPFADMWMAPVSLAHAIAALGELVRRPLEGIFQLSAISDISYAEAAAVLCRALGADPALVVSARAPDSIPPAERPRHTALDTARAEAEWGWQKVAVERTMTELVAS